MNEQEQAELVRQSALSGMSEQTAKAAQTSAATNFYVQEQEKNLAETQLEVETILIEARHLLRQDILEDGGDGRLKWVDIKDEKQRALTDWGVERLMQSLKAYINKNTLLSNFSEEQINKRMLKFMLALNGLLLMKYEFLFRQPTFEECKEILLSRIDEKKKLKVFALEIVGVVPNEGKIKKEMLFEVEHKVEYEINKIKQEQRKQKLREYELLITQLEAMVEATHNRAWKGEERGSIRRHTNISEVIGQQRPMPKEGGSFFKWGK